MLCDRAAGQKILVRSCAVYTRCFIYMRFIQIFCIFAFQMDIDNNLSEVLYGKLLELEKEVRRQLSEKSAENDAHQQILHEIE